MDLPVFRYHPDPVGSGSIAKSDTSCRCCKQSRGYLYHGPVYAETDLDDALCPWCIADGSAFKKFGATFVDSEAFADDLPKTVIAEIMERTIGFNAWQSERWPSCCGDATAFVMPAGIQEIQERFRSLEGEILSYIIYDLQVSGGAATRLLNSLRRDEGPTVFLFRCLHCERSHFYIDQA